MCNEAQKGSVGVSVTGKELNHFLKYLIGAKQTGPQSSK